MKIDISKMTLNDLELISPYLQYDFDNFWNENILKSEIENDNSYCIIAKIDNEIVGFSSIWKSIDDIHITNIVTKINKRNLGIASKLLEELLNQVKILGYSIVTLEVNENNLPAINLYEKFGFKKVGIRKKYYNNTDNAIIMNLYINV